MITFNTYPVVLPSHLTYPVEYFSAYGFRALQRMNHYSFRALSTVSPL